MYETLHATHDSTQQSFQAIALERNRWLMQATKLEHNVKAAHNDLHEALEAATAARQIDNLVASRTIAYLRSTVSSQQEFYNEMIRRQSIEIASLKKELSTMEDSRQQTLTVSANDAHNMKVQRASRISEYRHRLNRQCHELSTARSVAALFVARSSSIAQRNNDLEDEAKLQNEAMARLEEASTQEHAALALQNCSLRHSLRQQRTESAMRARTIAHLHRINRVQNDRKRKLSARVTHLAHMKDNIEVSSRATQARLQ
ncbi:hypothetical protein KCU78_g11493, partial [Aureobasidium melanogenum]